MTVKQPALLIIVLLGCLQTVFGQVSFDHYIPLQSKGPVPADFSKKTSQKIAEDSDLEFPELTEKEKKVFIEEVHYSIDELLKSGMVTYGDEVSTYIQAVGDRLCASDPDLVGKLRFYTLNTNDANAFSTNQGMVFVTTGLIAQMTNEAQLAFVLAHEIIHYRENHVLARYDYSMDNQSLSYREKMRFFSKHSRDNEFEADVEGAKLYHKAGYASSEISKAFDVLIYSNLPFEELPFDRTYFNSERLFVPEKIFRGQKTDISVNERYDDRLHSHPNIAKRVEQLDETIDGLADWGTVLNYPDRSFEEVREICRFEFLLNDVYENNTVDALYSIYILEKKHPESHFLRQCKSQLWLEKIKKPIVRYEPGIFGYLNKEEDSYYEGEISVLNMALNRLSTEAEVALGLRFIYDAYQKDTSDAVLKAIWDKSIEMAAFNPEFDLENFSELTFQQAIVKVEEEKQKTATDTLATPGSDWDKYETIKNKRSGITVDAGIDSTKFYLYAISDLVADSVFNARFDHFMKKMKEKEAEKDNFFALTDEEQYEEEELEWENELHIDMDTVLVLHPFVTEFEDYEDVDYIGSDKLEERLLGAVKTVSDELGIEVKYLDRTEQNAMTTQEYNDLAMLMRSMEKAVFGSEPDVFLLDQQCLDSLRNRYGSSKVMLIDLQHQYNSGITVGTGILFTVLFPVGLVYFPAAIMAGHTTDLNVYIMDLDKGEIAVEKQYWSDDQVSKKMLRLRMHALFHQLNESAE